MFVGKDNKIVRDIIRTKISSYLDLDSYIYNQEELTDFFCDLLLPTLISMYYQDKDNSFEQYVRKIKFKGPIIDNVTNRIRNLLSRIKENDYGVKNNKIKILGDIHPDLSTKVLSKDKVIYGNYPDYYDLLKNVSDLLFDNHERIFPRIEKNKNLYIREFTTIKKNTHYDKDIREFYYNLGNTIAFLLSIRAVDINAENMIVKLPYPVFFDMETIFSGQFEEGFDQYNVQNTGILKIEEDRDMSLITGGVGKRESLLKPIIAGSDRYPEIKWRTLSNGEWNNIPMINSNFVKPNKYLNDIKTGYEKMSHKILDNKNSILEIVNSSRAVCRVVLRPTRIYKYLIMQTVYPQIFTKYSVKDFLKQNLSELRVIYKLEDLKSVINYEIGSLYDFIIPTFYSDIMKSYIYSAEKEIVAKWVNTQYSIWYRYFINNLDDKYFSDQWCIIESKV